MTHRNPAPDRWPGVGNFNDINITLNLLEIGNLDLLPNTNSCVLYVVPQVQRDRSLSYES